MLEMRQRGRFAGFSLFISNSDVSTTHDIMSSTLCYKDGLQLPLINFTTICTEYGRYIIFYNERIPGKDYPAEYQIDDSVFTELCEVIIKGNKSSFYIFYSRINATYSKLYIASFLEDRK